MSCHCWSPMGEESPIGGDAALLHTKMAKELAMLQAAVSSTAESVVGHSPYDAFCIEVVDELAQNSKRLRISARGLSGLPLGYVTSSFSHCPAEPDWPII
jgi:hypothetical protein